MSALAKLLLLALFANLLMSGHSESVPGHAPAVWRIQLVRFEALCNREPRRPVCKKLGLGPVYGKGDDDLEVPKDIDTILDGY